MSKPTLSTEDHALLLRSPLFAGLDAAVRESVLQKAASRTLTRGETLFVQNDPATHLFVVLEGWVKVFRLTPEGTEAVIHVFRAGESLAEPAVFSLKHYPASCEAVADSRLLCVPGAALVEEIRRNPDLSLKVIGMFSQRLQSLVAETERRQTLSTPRRVASFLLDLIPPGTAPDAPVTVRLPFDKALIAARLAMTPESFSRALARLREHGVTSRAALVEISSSTRLERFIEGA